MITNDTKSGTKVTESGYRDKTEEESSVKREKLKKIAIFSLMGIVFVGTMYLLFKPEETTIAGVGINDTVPQANEPALQEDKMKMYEQEMQTDKKASALKSLADYWTTEEHEVSQEEESSKDAVGSTRQKNSSYQSAQRELATFYREENHEAEKLKKEVGRLKQELEQNEPKDDVDRQLEIMEKSYQLAAKYLPQESQKPKTETPIPDKKSEDNTFTVSKTGKSNVSTLSLKGRIGQDREFNTSVGNQSTLDIPATALKAVIQDDQIVIGEATVKLRILEPAVIHNQEVPQGTVLTAVARVQNGRLVLNVNSLELQGRILPVNLVAYDLDGLLGLNALNTAEARAFSEIAANMAQTSGTSISMTQSAGQQVAGDLSRGLIQGVSGYFSRKARMPKVSLKAGYRIFLVSLK